jgi:hypothetical protein
VIYIDLKARVPSQWGRRRIRRLAAAAVTLVAVGAAGVAVRRPRPVVATTRPLSIEERESVLSLVDPINVRLPQIHNWTSVFFRDFSGGKTAVRLDPRLGKQILVRVEGDSVVFSPAFFNTDPMTQEQWLVQIIGQVTHAVPDGAELAIRPEEPTTTGTE